MSQAMTTLLRLLPGGGGNRTRTNAGPSRQGSTRLKRTPDDARRSSLRDSKKAKLARASSPSPQADAYSNLSSRRNRELTPNQLRLVLMEDEQPRRVLFDSDTVVPVERGEVKGPMRLTPDGKLQLLPKRQKETEVLGQMLFGAVTCSTASGAFKVHTFTFPKREKRGEHLAPIDGEQAEKQERVLFSRTFVMPKTNRGGNRLTESVASSDSESTYNTVRSLDGLLGRSTTLASTVPPEQFVRVRNSSVQLDGVAAEDMERPFSPPSRLSRDRRREMAKKNSLSEQGGGVPWRWSRSRLSSCGSQTDEDLGRLVVIGFVASIEHRDFLFQHIPLIESELSRLEQKAVAASSNSSTFLLSVSQAWTDFCQVITQLYNTPRLRNPVWISLSERQLSEYTVANEFCRHMYHLAQLLENKESKFFLSNILTTVLMHHVSWVASVAAPQSSQGLNASLLIGTVTNDEATTNPYNPYTAQFLEINGHVGLASRTTRTVIVGTEEDIDLMTSLIHILSYFVRCSTVMQRTDSERCARLPLSHSFSPGASDLNSPPGELACSPISEEEDYAMGSVDAIPSLCSSTLTNASTSVSTATTSTLNGQEGLGRSLLTAPSREYSSHFVLSGLVKHEDNVEKAIERIVDDVRAEDSACQRVAATSLSSSHSQSSLGEHSSENLVIIADTEDFSVKVMSTEGVGEVFAPADHVVSMLETFCDLYRAHAAPKFMITQLEDSLSAVLGKSLSLVEMVRELSGAGECIGGASLGGSTALPSERVRRVVDCDHSDLRLIVNVAAVYYPDVLSSIL